MSFFEAVARLYELFRLAAKSLRDVDQIGLVRLKKAQDGCEQFRLPCPRAQLVSPDSGQIDKPLRPTLVTERCGKRAKRESDGVIWVSVHRR